MENQSQNSGQRYGEQSASDSPSLSRSLDRMLGEECGDGLGSLGGESPAASQEDLMREIREQVEILDSVFSATDNDRASVIRAIHVLSELAENEDMVNMIVDCAAVPALVKHLQAPSPLGREGEGDSRRLYEHELEKESAFTLGLLATKREHRQLIIQSGAVPPLVKMLGSPDAESRAMSSFILRRLAQVSGRVVAEMMFAPDGFVVCGEGEAVMSLASEGRELPKEYDLGGQKYQMRMEIAELPENGDEESLDRWEALMRERFDRALDEAIRKGRAVKEEDLS